MMLGSTISALTLGGGLKLAPPPPPIPILADAFLLNVTTKTAANSITILSLNNEMSIKL